MIAVAEEACARSVVLSDLLQRLEWLRRRTNSLTEGLAIADLYDLLSEQRDKAMRAEERASPDRKRELSEKDRAKLAKLVRRAKEDAEICG